MGRKTIRGYCFFNIGYIWISDGSLDSELELGFGSTVQLFVNRWIVAIECDIGSSTIRIPLKDEILCGWNCKERSKLHARHVSIWLFRVLRVFSS